MPWQLYGSISEKKFKIKFNLKNCQLDNTVRYSKQHHAFSNNFSLSMWSICHTNIFLLLVCCVRF